MPKFTDTVPRQRLTRTAATAPTGLYGSTKGVQRAAEAASRKLARHALKVAKRAFAKDEQVVPFLQAHLKRNGSKSAGVLLAAMKEIGPKLASEMRGGVPKEAGTTEYGLYGYKARTADLGLDACKEVRSHAGRISADLHRRKADAHAALTGFFKEHSKQAKCAYAGMLLSCYPDASMRVAAGDAPDLGIPIAAPDFAFDPTTGRSSNLFPVYARLRFPTTVTGHLRDVEVVPSEFRAFRAAVLRKAATVGVSPEKVAFGANPCADKMLVSAILNEDGRTRDVEGELVAHASWPGSERMSVPLAYTAEFEPMPVAGEKTVLASGDWIEWEE